MCPLETPVLNPPWSHFFSFHSVFVCSHVLVKYPNNENPMRKCDTSLVLLGWLKVSHMSSMLQTQIGPCSSAGWANPMSHCTGSLTSSKHHCPTHQHLVMTSPCESVPGSAAIFLQVYVSCTINFYLPHRPENTQAYINIHRGHVYTCEN